MSSDELIVSLINHGVRSGPITGTTRPLFERKLCRIISGVSCHQAAINIGEEERRKAEGQLTIVCCFI